MADPSAGFRGRIPCEFFALMCGERLGGGQFRVTFAHALDDCRVIKFECEEQGAFQNVNEWTVWQEVKGTRHAKWFAPCYAISAGGAILIQHKVEHRPDVLPLMIPRHFTDTKRRNWGFIGKRPVACDYGYASLMITDGLSTKLQKARWWDE